MIGDHAGGWAQVARLPSPPPLRPPSASFGPFAAARRAGPGAHRGLRVRSTPRGSCSLQNFTRSLKGKTFWQVLGFPGEPAEIAAEARRASQLSNKGLRHIIA